MKIRIILAVPLLLVVGITARAENPTRMVMYSFQDKGDFLNVGLLDPPKGPRGFVACPLSPKRQRAFSISREQFEQAWRVFQTAEARKFAVPKSYQLFDTSKNYLFNLSDGGPAGSQTDFVIPKNRASQALVSLARQLEKYAR